MDIDFLQLAKYHLDQACNLETQVSALTAIAAALVALAEGQAKLIERLDRITDGDEMQSGHTLYVTVTK